MNSLFARLGVTALLFSPVVRARASDATAQAPGAAQGTPAPTPNPNSITLGSDVKANSYDQLGVVNNLYALDHAAKKFFLLHSVDKVTYAELVGPDKLVADVKPVAGEDYTQLVFEKGQRIEIHMPDGRVIHYPLGSGPISSPAGAQPAAAPIATAPMAPAAKPPPSTASVAAAAQDAGILENLRTLSEAADKYYKDNDTTSTTYWQLVGPEKYLASIKPKEGEDYRSLLFKQGHPLRLYLKDGRVILYPPPEPQQKVP